MNISIWKCALYFLTGGSSKVVDYVLGKLNESLDALGSPTKDKLQAVLNFAQKCLNVLSAMRAFIPTKWQTAFMITLSAVEKLIASISDLELTGEELHVAVDSYKLAYQAWMGPDDETCKA